ncbi:MAG: M48 family metallopeptidase [Chloroflexi bacterium]|nr:M48 family metallopeptidase [Chloroflexota bacterium]
MRQESGLTVVLPKGCAMKRAAQFIREKQDWILRHFARFDEMKSCPQRTEITPGDVVPYLGAKLKVCVEVNAGRTECVRLERDRLTASLTGTGRRLNMVLEQWYRTRAAELITAKVAGWSQRLKVRCNRISIREQRTRWGSCSAKGNLSFNWKLLMAPEAVIDYVVIHELCHLKELNHSGKFWQFVASYCPGWRERKQWLRTNEADLRAGLLARQ